MAFKNLQDNCGWFYNVKLVKWFQLFNKMDSLPSGKELGDALYELRKSLFEDYKLNKLNKKKAIVIDETDEVEEDTASSY